MTFEEVLVDVDLLGGVVGLGGDVAVVVEEGLVLGVELEALVLEVVALPQHRLQLHRQGVVYELLLDPPLQLLEQPNQLPDLYLVRLYELLLVTHHRPLETLVHALRSRLYAAQQSLYERGRLPHRVERHLFHYIKQFL